MTLKGVIFDMDGVIVDSEPLHYEAESRIFARLGITVPGAMRNSFIGMSGAGMWRTVRDEFTLAQSVGELLEIDRKLRLEFFSGLDRLDPVAGALDLLKEISGSGLKTALASSSSPDLIDIILDRLDARRYFGAVISGDTVPRGKPAPDIFLRALELIGARAGSCVVIEDSRNGVIAAKAAGLRCVAYRNPNSPGQDLSAADMIIDDFRTLSVRGLRALAGE